MTCNTCNHNNPNNRNPHFPGAPLVINNPCDPVLFHKVPYSATLGTDDNTQPNYVNPSDLSYKNVLLVFEATGHAYLYSSDGIPTFISYLPSDQNVDELVEKLNQEIQERQAADEEITAKLAAEIAARIAQEDKLSEDITTVDAALAAETDARKAADTAILTTLGQLKETVVQTDTAVSTDASTVTLTKTTGELYGVQTDTAMPLPVADETQAGVMNPATYQAVQANSENIDSILNGAVFIEGLPTSPTQEELTDQWKAETGKDVLINRASIYDKTNGKIWYYYTNVNEWQPADIQNPEVNISVATNDSLGIVKGSAEDGQIAIEADGSMSLNNYDGINHDLENLTQLVQSIDVPKVPKYIAGSDKSVIPSDIITWDTPGPNYNLSIRVKSYDSTSGTSTIAQQNAKVPRATQTTDGVMSFNDKAKLDSLLEIKSLGDNLTLSEDGELSASGGGGSDVNLLNEYTETVENSDVYNAEYVNNRLNNTSIVIGENAIKGEQNNHDIIIGHAASGAKNNNGSVIVIGYNAYAGGTPGGSSRDTTSSVVIGQDAHSERSRGVALGRYARVDAASGVAVGQSTRVSHDGSVALGSGSLTGRLKEVSIGDGKDNSASKTRFLANVTAGELPTDAVNLQQMQDYVAEHGGGGGELDFVTPEEFNELWENL